MARRIAKPIILLDGSRSDTALLSRLAGDPSHETVG